MKTTKKMESVLITLMAILVSIMLVKLALKLRTILPWRVNCWFCNSNCWVKFPVRNCWTCSECEQYNGFTKDGDYNKTIIVANEQTQNTPKVFRRSPPKNGLCKMCNINQQLKVTQLANFVPMNDKSFDSEISSYRLQLEKAYKLCSPCRKYLQIKLHKEKETLLGTKLLETRTPEKKNQKGRQSNLLKSLVKSTSKVVALMLLLLVATECYKNILKLKSISVTINNLYIIVRDLHERLITILKMKFVMTFPSSEVYIDDINKFLYIDKLNVTYIGDQLEYLNLLAQTSLGGFICLVQIIGHSCNANTLLTDILWTVIVVACISDYFIAFHPVYISFIKLISVMAVLLVYKSMKEEVVRSEVKKNTPKRMKNLMNGSVNAMDEDDMTVDTDDDVSLSKFGVHNFSDSSNDTGPMSSSFINGRCFTPRSDGLWTKPKLNSTFCVNTASCKSPSSVSDTVFAKPMFNKYQKLTKDDSDSDLDESISCLCIGSPKKSNGNSVFSLRKFNATPQFVAPMPLSRSRPLISPSKLGHSTSWVAGGYWGSEGDRQLFNMDGSRSSSQSSGFESQASSATQRVFSHPSSREQSVFGDTAASVMMDRFQSCQTQFTNTQAPQNFGRVTSPVFPQMQYNSHVHIPQARLTPQAPQSAFSKMPHYVPRGLGGSGLIKLPPVNSFSTHSGH